MTHQLNDFCISALDDGTVENECWQGQGLYDSYWSCIVLLSYLMLDHRGRSLLSHQFTAMDQSLVKAIASYGFTELRSRRNYEEKRKSLIMEGSSTLSELI